MVLYSPYFWKTDFYIFHFGVKKMELYTAKKKGNDIHLEKYSRSQLGHIFKNSSGPERQNGSI